MERHCYQLLPEVLASRCGASDGEIAVYFLERIEQCIEYGELAFVAMDLPGYLRVRPDMTERLNRILSRADALRHKLIEQAQQSNRPAAHGVVEDDICDEAICDEAERLFKIFDAFHHRLKLGGEFIERRFSAAREG